MENGDKESRKVLQDILEMIEDGIQKLGLTKKQKQEIISAFVFGIEGYPLRDYILNWLELAEEVDLSEVSLEELEEQAENGLYTFFLQCQKRTNDPRECQETIKSTIDNFLQDIDRRIEEEKKYRKEENKKDRR